MSDAHHVEIRVYYEDTDLGGVVYYANYLKYFERARSEMLRALDVDQAALLADEGLGFVVRRIEVDYRASARFDDLLRIETRILGQNGARIEMAQTALRGDQALVAATVTIVLINRDGRPRRLPQSLAARLNIDGSSN